MTETLISSSVLILALIAIRIVFKGKISRRLQYALWGLVLLRLLLPFSLLKSTISVMNVLDASKITEPIKGVEVYSNYIKNSEMTPGEAQAVGKGKLSEIKGYPPDSEKSGLQSYIFKDSLDKVLGRVLGLIWIIGAAAAGIWFTSANISFYLKLRRTREKFSGCDCALPVYITEAVASPCLYGAVRPSIYITPKSAEDSERLRFVLAHEYCHYRQIDHIWPLLRGLCLAAYWWNPLVWAAGVLSRLDSEMACDEAVIRKLGEDCRFGYGRALVDMISVRKAPVGLMCGATTMISGKRGIKSRLDMIIRNQKTAMPALFAVLMAAALCVGCTFTGAKSQGITAEQALSQLESSITYTDSDASFTIPKDYKSPENWNIHIAGRAQYDDGFSSSMHFYEDVNDKKGWEPGKTYSVPTGKEYTELTLNAYLPDGKGGSLEKSLTLLKPPSYTLKRMGSDTKIVLTNDGAILANRAIMDAMLKSFALPAVDITTLDECYQIEATYRDGKVSDYYVFAEDGYAYLQMGEKGSRCRLNDELYKKIKLRALMGSPSPTTTSELSSSEERFAREYINTVKDTFKERGVVIKDSKIKSLKRIGRYENLAEYPIELWLLEYRLLPEDMSKVIFAGGMSEEDGWITEYSSAGQPLLIISYQNGSPSCLGSTWTLMAMEEGGEENALRKWLEDSRLIKPETYPGYHYTVTFNLYDGRPAKLIMSQPVRGGDTGIWCAERWYESNGGSYLVPSNPEGPASGSYVELQDQCDGGQRPGLLDPKQAALEFLTSKKLVQNTDSVTIGEKYSGVDTDVVIWHLINVISSSPASSSNPGDYIKAHRSDYDILVNGGENTLRYIYREFLKGGQTGLPGHIILSLLKDILGSEMPDLRLAVTGQEAFNNFKDWAVNNRESVIKERPKIALLFDYL